MNKKIKDLNFFQICGLLGQILLTFFVLVFLFLAIGVSELMFCVKIYCVLLFLMMAYNNQILYKRKGFTIIYLLISLMFLVNIIYG